MSTNLYWRPVPREIPPARTVNALKRAIARRVWDHDGSLHGDTIIVGTELLPYLEGLRDAGTEETREDASELIEAIQEHGSVEIWIAS